MTVISNVTDRPGLGGLPQFIRYASAYPDPKSLLMALRSGPLARRGMLAGTIWILVDGTHLMSIAWIGWGRDVVERYSIIPLELDLPAVHAVLEDRATIDAAGDFGELYMSSIDGEFLGTRFTDLGVASVINTPLRHAGMVVGDLGFVTSHPWSDDDEGSSLLDTLSHLLGLWATHPRSSALDTLTPMSQREWSLAFTARQKQVLRLVGEGLSNTDIARRLMVSNSSVKQDLQHAMRALRTHNRQGAHDRARELGLLT